jgi:hypothetical protein
MRFMPRLIARLVDTAEIMTSFKILAGIVLCWAAAAANAALSSEGKVTVHEVEFGGCHFKMKDPYGGTLQATHRSSSVLANYNAKINPTSSHPFETEIQFSCQNPVNEQTLSELAGIKMIDRRWVLDTSPDSIGPPEAHTTFYPLHGENWEAGGVTQDDINGDKDRRTRVFAFCIPHNKLALCGVVRDVAYLSHLNESILPEVVQLLEIIEFVDTSTSKNTGAASGYAVPNQ